MARTTVTLDGALLSRIKKIAADSREDVSTTMDRLLRQSLRAPRPVPRRSSSATWHVVKGGGPAAGFDPATRDHLDLLDS